MSHYYWKTDPERYPQLKEIFAAAESHARYLAQDQEYKIVELTKMLIEIFFSKLEFKSLFVF